MKNLFALFIVSAVFTLVSCENEPLEGDFVTGGLTCEAAVTNTAEAALNFLSVNDDNYTQLCIAYRNALQAQIQACGDPDGSLQVAVDALGNCSNNQQATEVEGTWLLTAWIGEEPIDLNNDGTESTNFLDEMDCYTNETIVFSNDGTGVAMSTSYAEFTFEIVVGTENEYTYTVDCISENENTNVTWTQSGNTVSISDDFGTTEWTVNGNEMSITLPDGWGASNEDGSVVITQDLTFVYTKQ